MLARTIPCSLLRILITPIFLAIVCGSYQSADNSSMGRCARPMDVQSDISLISTAYAKGEKPWYLWECTCQVYRDRDDKWMRQWEGYFQEIRYQWQAEVKAREYCERDEKGHACKKCNCAR